MTQAGVQLINARGSCTLDTRCGVTRVVGIASLGAKKRMRIEIPIPGKIASGRSSFFADPGMGLSARVPTGILTTQS